MPVRTNSTFGSVFSSSVPQRPVERGPTRAFGGRPLGPNSYNPSMPQWHNDPQRPMSSFASKTQTRNYATPLTSQIDFLNPDLGPLVSSRGEAPGSRGLEWPVVPAPSDVERDRGLDEFCDALTGSVGSEVSRSARKYSSVFNSAHRRNLAELRNQPFHTSAYTRTTSPLLGPGVYDTPLNDGARVRDPKRASCTFKSETSSSIFGTPAGQPPDAVQSIQSAILSRHWTSKGVAFSTRERFPRDRPKWKE